MLCCPPPPSPHVLPVAYTAVPCQMLHPDNSSLPYFTSYLSQLVSCHPYSDLVLLQLLFAPCHPCQSVTAASTAPPTHTLRTCSQYSVTLCEAGGTLKSSHVFSSCTCLSSGRPWGQMAKALEGSGTMRALVAAKICGRDRLAGLGLNLKEGAKGLTVQVGWRTHTMRWQAHAHKSVACTTNWTIARDTYQILQACLLNRFKNSVLDSWYCHLHSLMHLQTQATCLEHHSQCWLPCIHGPQKPNCLTETIPPPPPCAPCRRWPR